MLLLLSTICLTCYQVLDTLNIFTDLGNTKNIAKTICDTQKISSLWWASPSFKLFSALQAFSPTLKYWPHPLLPGPSQKNSKSENLTPLPSLEMCPHPQKTHFLKKWKILSPTLNQNTFECWNMNIQLQI